MRRMALPVPNPRLFHRIGIRDQSSVHRNLGWYDICPTFGESRRSALHGYWRRSYDVGFWRQYYLESTIDARTLKNWSMLQPTALGRKSQDGTGHRSPETEGSFAHWFSLVTGHQRRVSLGFRINGYTYPYQQHVDSVIPTPMSRGDAKIL